MWLVHSCSHWLRPRNPPPPPHPLVFGLTYEGGHWSMVSQDGRHLLVTPWFIFVEFGTANQSQLVVAKYSTCTLYNLRFSTLHHSQVQDSPVLNDLNSTLPLSFFSVL